MNWIGRLSVGAKLIMSFCAVSIFTAAVGGMGIYRMAAINQELERLYKHELIGTAAAMDVAICVPSIGRDGRQMILESHENQAQMTEIESRMDGFVKRMEDALKTLDETTFAEDSMKRIATIKTNFPGFMAVLREGVKEARAGNDAAATAKIFESLKVGAPTRDAAAELVKAKRENAERIFNESAAAYRTARLVMIVFVVAGVVLSVVLGAIISRWFTRAVVQVDEISGLVASASQELAAASEQLSSGAQQSASSLEETASSLEQMTATVKQNAENADQANQLANNSRSTAEQGGEVVASAVTAMAEINQASKKIADIITTIDEIAFQTNLLALNAAVEAARAGEQGRGFAVVAGEVRNLAQRSATAAREIKGLIQDSVQKVETGSALVNRSGETLSAIVASVKKVTDIVAEIAAASREQAAGIDQINKAVAQMDQVTQSNASQTEEMSGTAVALSGQAEHLQAVVSQFNIQKNDEKREPATSSSRATATEANKTAKSGKPARKPKPKTAKQADREMELVGAGAGEFSGFEEF